LLICDWIAAIISWLLFFIYRKRIEEPQVSLDYILADPRLIIGLMIIPIVWILFWSFFGLYQRTYRKSRLQVLYMTIVGSIIGSLGLLFTVIRDDTALSLISYLQSFVAVLIIHFSLFLVMRMLILSIYKWQLKNDKHRFTGAIISDQSKSSFLPMRFTSIEEVIDIKDYNPDAHYKSVDSLALISNDKISVNRLLPILIGTSRGRDIFVGEETLALLNYDYKGTPFLLSHYIALQTHPMWAWQRNGKRCFDLMSSLIMILLLSPLLVWLYYKVKRSSEGPCLFRQERLGKNGTPFTIYKFRSMFIDAEEDGPALALDDDERCTPFGRWMRRWRLDELPQFFNVIRGDMSLVGPRPERSFYAYQLLDINPKYALLWQVKPGITSWGQIKFGYASNIKEMLRRFRFDLLYVEQMSILLDFRILYYTLIVLWQGKGR